MTEANAAKKKLPIWIWIVAVLAGLTLLGAIFGEDETEEEVTQSQEEVIEPSEKTAEVGEATESKDVVLESAILRMAIVDETSSGIPEEFEIWIRGTGSWFYSQGAVIEDGGPFAVSEAATFFIYPEGRDSNEIEVNVLVPEDVIPGSIQHTIFISVYDDELEVYGTSIDGGEVRFSR